MGGDQDMISAVDPFTRRAMTVLAWLITFVVGAALARFAHGAGPDREMTITWPDGTVVTSAVKPRIAGDHDDPCDMMIRHRRWQPVGAPHIADAIAIECHDSPGQFTPRSNCIEGYNCR